jgi:cell fate (sporulation/competence/biofilm development) regulator YlbF (YheA/YmcA/DUF963 family)
MTKTMLSPDLIEAVEMLAENVLASEPFVRFEDAYTRFEADAKASRLMRDLTDAQNGLRMRQTNGGLTQEDIVQFRALQMQAQANRLISGYIQAQNVALDSLKEINQEISQALGVDFAALARRPSSCCG